MRLRREREAVKQGKGGRCLSQKKRRKKKKKGKDIFLLSPFFLPFSCPLVGIAPFLPSSSSEGRKGGL